MKAQNIIGTKVISPFPHYTVAKNNFSVREEMSQALDSLISLVVQCTGVTERELSGGTRKGSIPMARQIYYAVTAEVIKPAFGQVFTFEFVTRKLEQDHTTMISAVYKHDKDMAAFSKGDSPIEQKNAAYKKLYREIKGKFVLLMNPSTDENFIQRHEVIRQKIADLREHLWHIDEELKSRGYMIINGEPVKPTGEVKP